MEECGSFQIHPLALGGPEVGQSNFLILQMDRLKPRPPQWPKDTFTLLTWYSGSFADGRDHPYLHFLLHPSPSLPPVPIYKPPSLYSHCSFATKAFPCLPPLFNEWISFHPSSRISLHITSSEESSRIPPILEEARWRKGALTLAEFHSGLNAITRPRCLHL